jgi:hypothetical protein
MDACKLDTDALHYLVELTPFVKHLAWGLKKWEKSGRGGLAAKQMSRVFSRVLKRLRTKIEALID